MDGFCVGVCFGFVRYANAKFLVGDGQKAADLDLGLPVEWVFDGIDAEHMQVTSTSTASKRAPAGRKNLYPEHLHQFVPR